MKNTQEFLERFNRWKNGAPIQELYKAGRPVTFEDGKDASETPKEDPAYIQALQYAIAMKLDKYNEGKDEDEPSSTNEYNFNAIQKISQNAPLSYGKYYDVTGDINIDARLPKYKGGKESYTGADDLISHYEGFRDTVYQNKGDVPTVGYGTTAQKWIDLARKQGKLTKAQGRQAMTEHLADSVIPQLRKNIPGYDDMPEQAQWVLQDILYNVGEGNLFQRSPNFMRAIRKGDWAGAAAQMDWDNNKKGYETGARERNAERQRLWNAAWGVQSMPNTAVEMIESQPKFRPGYTYVERGPLSTSQAVYNPTVPSYINKDAGVATWPRTTVLPDIKSLMDTQLNDKLPLIGYDDGKTGWVRDDNNNQIRFNKEGKFEDQITGETGTLQLPEVKVIPREYRSLYHPEDVENFFNLTGIGYLFNPFRLARTTQDFIKNPSFDTAVPVAHDVLPWSKGGRFLLGAYGLGNEEGLSKTYNFIQNGEYGSAALSATGDVLNALMTIEGGAGAANQLKTALNPKYADLNIPSLDFGLTKQPVAETTSGDLQITGQQPIDLLSRVTPRLAPPKKQYSKPNINISSKDFKDIVSEDGSINKEAFERAIDIYSKLNKHKVKYSLDDVVGSDQIRKHIYDVVKTAQDSPVPKGYTKQEQVAAALFHDIGKIYGYEGHGTSGWMMLYPAPYDRFTNEAIMNVPLNIRKAVRDHMSTTTFGSDDQLLKATQFADVARGNSYDIAALKYPHLLYEREGLKTPQYPKIPLREEIRKYINPWLKDNGYGPRDSNGKYTGIPLDATEEQAWSIVEDAVKQHRRVLRGSRLSTGSNSMSKETQDLLAEVRDKDLAKTIIDRPITEQDKILWEQEHINGTPTGYGRLSIFDNHQPRHGLSYNTQGHNASRWYKIDPDVYDVKYTSLSDDVSDHYASSGNRRGSVTSTAQLVGGHERTPEMSMREYIALNDWDLYSGSDTYPIGMYNMLASPFRLQTGKSLFYESSKGLKPPRKGNDGEYKMTKPTEEEFKIQSEADSPNYGSFSPDFETIAKVNDYIETTHEIEDINRLVKDSGFDDFEIKLGKDESIYYPRLIHKLHRELREVQRIKDSEVQSYKDEINKIQQYIGTRGIDDIKQDIHDTRKMHFTIYPEDAPEEIVIADDISATINILISKLDPALTDKESQFLHGAYARGDIDKIINYINKRDLLSNYKKRVVKFAKERYFDGIEKLKKESKEVDYKKYYRQVRDPERLIKIVREAGVVPRYEQAEFNKTMSIQTAGGTHTLGGKQKRANGLESHQMATVGKFGEKVLDTEENSFNSASGNKAGAGRRDIGKRSNKKLTHKTLASILPFIFGNMFNKKDK